MLAADVASTVVEQMLLFFGVLLGPSCLVGMVIYALAKKGRKVLIARRQRYFLRSLPCRQCQYLSDCEWLPCAVHPSHALTEAALNCPDFTK